MARAAVRALFLYHVMATVRRVLLYRQYGMNASFKPVHGTPRENITIIDVIGWLECRITEGEASDISRARFNGREKNV